MKKLIYGALASISTLLMAAVPLTASAQTAANNTNTNVKYAVSPWTFDPDEMCSGVTSQWTNDDGNPAPALHLTKPCATPTNASSGASVKGVNGITLTELNFDYKGYCGAGAPRFNVQASDGFHFIGGCANGTTTDLGNGWKHVTFDPSNPTQAYPIIAPGATVQTIDIVFDEGTDMGTGAVYLDNISVNDQIIGSPHRAKSADECKNGGWMTMQDWPNNMFKNQGQCVSWVQHNVNGNGNGQVQSQSNTSNTNQTQNVSNTNSTNSQNGGTSANGGTVH